MNRLIDSTVISNFSSIQRLELLRDTVSPLYLPVEVYHEILNGQMEGYAFYQGIEQLISPLYPNGWLHLVTMNEDELALLATLPERLHSGEVACLCIARQRGWGILTDDRAARKQAQAWNILVSGTLGVLVLAVQDERISVDEANDLLQGMVIHAKYRSPIMDIRQLLKPKS